MRHHVQPRKKLVRRNQQASEEIQKFFTAVDSYPERVAQEPSLSFRRHLSTLLEASPDRRGSQ